MTLLFSKQKLCVVFLGNVGTQSSFDLLKSRFIHGAIRKWGENFQHIIMEPQPSESLPREFIKTSQLPGMLWEQDGIEMMVTFPPSTNTSRQENKKDLKANQNALEIGLKGISKNP